MNILIEGWRGINHSYALVNQLQILELIKTEELYFKDIPFFSKKWDTNKNFSGLDKKKSDIINEIPITNDKQTFDITYRISYPFNFNNYHNSKLLYIYATTEYKYLNKTSYINNSIELLNTEEKIFIHTPSQWSKKGFVNAGLREDQVVVIPSGVDIDLFKKISDEEKKLIKKKYQIKDDEFILTNIGAMTQNKGVDVLIVAYGILKKKYKNLKLILKDQSNLYDIKPDYLFEKIKSSGFNDKYKIINEEMMKDIKIISDNINLYEIRDLYSITDCYVSPYLAEGFNLTPLEAAACGTQIVVTKGGSTDDYFDSCLGYQIESNEKKIDNSYLLEPKIDSLIQILEETILNNSDKLKNDRSKFVHQNYSWTKVVSKLKEEFKDKLK